MIAANHSRLHTWFFDRYIGYILRKQFRKVNITGHVEPTGQPILTVGNHFSWWDGFFVLYLNRKLFRRKVHIMMLEEQLKPRMFLTRIGGYSISPRTRSVMDSLRYTVNLLNDSKNMAVIFPQGEIKSAYDSPLRFQKGLQLVLNKTAEQTPVQMVFMVALVDYFSYQKPSLTLAIQEYRDWNTPNAKSVEDAYNEFFQQTIQRQNLLYK